MSFKSALSDLVDRMFRHADLDEALGIDDLTRLERGLPLLGASGSIPAPDFGEDGPTMTLAPAQPHHREGGRGHALAVEESEDPSWLGPASSADDGWMSKGWTIPEDRASASLSLNSSSVDLSPAREPESIAQAPTASVADPHLLVAPLLDEAPPTWDLFSDIEDQAVVSFEALKPATASDMHDPRPPVRDTEEITAARITISDPTLG
jgi:hypothetical protein